MFFFFFLKLGVVSISNLDIPEFFFFFIQTLVIDTAAMAQTIESRKISLKICENVGFSDEGDKNSTKYIYIYITLNSTNLRWVHRQDQVWPFPIISLVAVTHVTSTLFERRKFGRTQEEKHTGTPFLMITNKIFTILINVCDSNLCGFELAVLITYKDVMQVCVYVYGCLHVPRLQMHLSAG